MKLTVLYCIFLSEMSDEKLCFLLLKSPDPSKGYQYQLFEIGMPVTKVRVWQYFGDIAFHVFPSS